MLSLLDHQDDHHDDPGPHLGVRKRGPMPRDGLSLPSPTPAVTENGGFPATPLGAAKGLEMRPEARVAVGQPISVEPYRQMANPKEARALLTADLHRAMVGLKDELAKPRC